MYAAGYQKYLLTGQLALGASGEDDFIHLYPEMSWKSLSSQLSSNGELKKLLCGLAEADLKRLRISSASGEPGEQIQSWLTEAVGDILNLQVSKIAQESDSV